jgi:hypothetical protein
MKLFGLLLVTVIGCGGSVFDQGGVGGAAGSNASGGSAGTGGSKATGGSEATGGTIGTGGALGTGGAGGGPVDCTGATVTFRMVPAAGNPDVFCDSLGCGGSWLTISPEGGQPMPLSGMCTTTCSMCQMMACDMACMAPQVLTPAGREMSWDGSLYPRNKCVSASTSWGGGQTIDCVDKVCAGPGKYVAKMCAYRSTDPTAAICQGTTTPTCVEVPFSYPGDTIVTGTIAEPMLL